MVATYVGWAMMVCIVVATYSVWAMIVLDHAAAQGTAVHTPATLEVGGDVRTPLSLTPSELKAMPRTRIEVKNDDGRTVTYEGVLALRNDFWKEAS
jgi:hypothetical protein